MKFSQLRAAPINSKDLRYPLAHLESFDLFCSAIRWASVPAMFDSRDASISSSRTPVSCLFLLSTVEMYSRLAVPKSAYEYSKSELDSTGRATQ